MDTPSSSNHNAVCVRPLREQKIHFYYGSTPGSFALLLPVVLSLEPDGIGWEASVPRSHKGSLLD